MTGAAYMTWDGTTLASAPVSALFVSFLVYGFIGWAWESTACAMANRGYFANSGFLLGPCCPIYGVGGIACWLLLRGITNLAQQFVAAALVCSVIEYATGVLLEKTCGARFWDYTRFPFNLQGRVCLYGACIFGSGALIICRIIQPAIFKVLNLLPSPAIIIGATVLALCLGIDVALSVASWRKLSNELERVRADLSERIDDSLHDASDSMLERVPANALDSANNVYVRGKAVNGWLAEITDAAMDAVRERASTPAFIADGTRGLALAARRAAEAGSDMGRRAAEAGANAARSVIPQVSLRRRELRFFNAFPRMRINSYEGVIRATQLKERARELFHR